MPTWSVEFSTAARRAFAKVDPSVKRRITSAIEELRHDPRPASAKRLVGRADYWRIRVGAYRVVYALEDDRLVILVVTLGHRRSVYRGL
jgi:mRNA interferase RelE/StbE